MGTFVLVVALAKLLLANATCVDGWGEAVPFPFLFPSSSIFRFPLIFPFVAFFSLGPSAFSSRLCPAKGGLVAQERGHEF